MPFTGFTYPTLGARGNPTTVYTEAIVPVGTIGTDNDGNQWIFLPGVASVVAGDFVTYNPATFATARLVANAVGPVAVFLAAVDSTSEYGWAFIEGTTAGANAINAGACAAGALLYITATTAVVDDVKVVGDLIVGAFCSVAEAAGKISVRFIHPPHVGNVLPAA